MPVGRFPRLQGLPFFTKFSPNQGKRWRPVAGQQAEKPCRSLISSVGIRTLITALGALGRRFESCRPDWVFIKGLQRFPQIFPKSLPSRRSALAGLVPSCKICAIKGAPSKSSLFCIGSTAVVLGQFGLGRAEFYKNVCFKKLSGLASRGLLFVSMQPALFYPHDRPANRAELPLSVLIASASSVASRLCEIFSSRESSIRRNG